MTFQELEEYKKELEDWLKILKIANDPETRKMHGDTLWNYSRGGFKNQNVLEKTYKHKYIISGEEFVMVCNKPIHKDTKLEHYIAIFDYELEKVRNLVFEQKKLDEKLRNF